MRGGEVCVCGGGEDLSSQNYGELFSSQVGGGGAVVRGVSCVWGLEPQDYRERFCLYR